MQTPSRAMRLLIQIPCLNEEECLPVTMHELPRALPGFDDIGIVVVDDGSHDGTAELAERLGAQTVRVPRSRGLAHAFMIGIEACLELGADIIVNTDADNQYVGADVARLVAPIVEGRADVVIGARPISSIATFSPTKRLLQRLGSWTVRLLSGTEVADATSGFRAFSREAALRLNVFSRYTYTLETIVQATQCDLRVISVPIRTNAAMRKSRLVRNNIDYVWRSGSALLRMSIVYRPFRFFMLPALASFALATVIGLRFVADYIGSGGVAGHVQSLILTAILYGVSVSLAVVAFLGDLFTINRRLLEDLQLYNRRRRFDATMRGARPADPAVRSRSAATHGASADDPAVTDLDRDRGAGVDSHKIATP